MERVSTAGRGTTAKGITLLCANILPVMAIVSLFPAIPKLFRKRCLQPTAVHGISSPTRLAG